MKAAIIGAGVAGLTAARELAKRGVQVKVFEKSRGVGGRLANKRLDWGVVDFGAPYFTACDARFQKQLAQWQKQGVAADWQFDPYFLTSAGLVARPDSTLRCVGTPKMNSVAHALSRDIDIAFNIRVEAIEHSSDGWMLLPKDGEAIKERFDWLVLSLPAEQSRALALGTAIEHQIPEQIHEPCWALALATRGEVPTDIQSIAGDDVVAWVTRLSAYPQRPTSGEYDDLWMLHFSSHWSAIHGKDTGVDVTQTGTQWLTAALDKHGGRRLEFVHDFKHFWRYARVANGKEMSSIIADRSSGIAAIGGWSANGGVEGAYLSALNFVDFCVGKNS